MLVSYAKNASIRMEQAKLEYKVFLEYLSTKVPEYKLQNKLMKVSMAYPFA